MGERRTVQIGGRDVVLGRPPSVAVAVDVVQALAKNELRGMAAALGICWEAGGSRSPPAAYKTCGYDALLYGGKVIDQLTARGLALTDWMEAAQLAAVELMALVPAAKEVAAAEDFSAPLEESSTS